MPHAPNPLQNSAALRFPCRSRVPSASAVADRRSEASMAEEAAQEQPSHVASRPVRCIVKLGGAAITNKGDLESINEGSLRSACAQLRQAMSDADSAGPEKVLGMDWSRRRGDPADPVVDAEGFAGMVGLGLDTNFVVVHGAGSFGHFQASRSGVHKGGLHSTLVKAGFVATRISVTSLNQEIVRALAREGIPSVGMSPFACGWSTRQRNLASADAFQIIQSLHAGFVPVLHGDAVLDELLDCTILSGDVIIRHLAQLLNPKYVVFLTDVHGVYDRPPTDPNAVLLREIEVDGNGSWSIVKPALLQGNNKGVEISVAAHDTTGGMETKILEATMITRLGIDVYITKAGTEHSLRALKGDVSTDSEDWLGTVIRSSK
ncbi:isopentenyl phosphate kinase-like [Phragmites australis]|uniref:isopentenyl phosphate kinase-like n=1 Tax=Phragmites australis TaxID=29695 RepID=UPI002D786D26|nr:isopentenyl phosphate kinase-like [Phragmites australis]